MEYDPMATSSNPNDCMTLISVGCLDDNSPNYAGADLDVDSIHPYANNYGDAFGENYMIDLKMVQIILILIKALKSIIEKT